VFQLCQLCFIMEWLDSLKSFHRHLQAEDYPQAIALAPLLLEQISPPTSNSTSSRGTSSTQQNGNADHANATIRNLVAQGYARCLLETEDFARLEQVIKRYELETSFPEWYRYALYRLDKFDEAMVRAGDSSGGKDSRFDKHLRAQSLYHLSKTDEAGAIYQDLLKQRDTNDKVDGDEREQVIVNWTASVFDQALPYVNQSRPILEVAVKPYLEASVCPMDLAYNFASLRLMEGDASARSLLETARRHATDSRDLNRIKYNLEWSNSFMAGTLSSTKSQATDPHVELSQLATRGASSDDAKFKLLTGLQSRMALYNAAVNRLRQGKAVECQKLCKSLLAAVDRSELYWTSRAVVLLAYCCDKAKGLDLLQAQLDKVLQAKETPARDAAWLFLELHRAEIAGEGLNVANFPQSVQSSNGVLASKSLLQSASESNNSAIRLSQVADQEMSFKEYSKASALYRQVLEGSTATDPVAKARLVAALSHVDPQQAISLWGDGRHSLSSDHSSPPRLVDEDLNGAELEQRELPRLKMHRATIPGGGGAASGGPSSAFSSKSPQKDRDAVLRRRANKRDQYLLGLEDKGLYNKDRPTNPDPERWLPKVERSHYRRTKKGGGSAGNKGSQGGVSEKAAAKLDVVARQQQLQQGRDTATPSTAHLVATSQGGVGRKGGRKR
jgi:SRP72 RNA-binding domain